MLESDGVPLDAWASLSRHYNRQLWLERSAVRRALELLHPQRHERLLDLGTGTGEVLRQLAGRPVRPQQVIGIDQSPAMLSHVQDLPLGWSTQFCDARELPFTDARFDAAVASYVLHLMGAADLPIALAELRRVLRAGGRVVTTTPAIPPSGPARRLARGLDRLAVRDPRRYGGLHALDVRPSLAAAGFEIVDTRWSLHGYPTLCVLARLTA